jgi:hypothetical protein
MIRAHLPLGAYTTRTHRGSRQERKRACGHHGHQPVSACLGLPQPAGSARMPRLSGTTRFPTDPARLSRNTVRSSSGTVPRSGTIVLPVSLKRANDQRARRSRLSKPLDPSCPSSNAESRVAARIPSVWEAEVVTRVSPILSRTRRHVQPSASTHCPLGVLACSLL